MEKRCPDCGAALPKGVPEWVRQLRVADAMTVEPATMGPEDSLMRAVEVMQKNGIRRVPIVVADTLVGILAQGDLNRAQPSALSNSQEDFSRVMEETPVSRLMIPNPVTISEETSLYDATKTLHQMKFGALPVTRDGRLVGILTDSDLLRCLIDLLAHGG
jgi:acetoin utilization protein AcuB